MAEETETEQTQEVQSDQESGEDLSLEESMKAVEEVIKKMESGDLSLEESFTAYQQGMKLLNSCNEKIDKVEKQVQELDEQGEPHEFKS